MQNLREKLKTHFTPKQTRVKQLKWKKPPEELVQFLAQKTKNLKCDYRKMFGYPAYFVNGYMFTGIYQDQLFIRVSEADGKKIKQTHPEVAPFEPMPGRTMKNYVVFPQQFYSNDQLFTQWLESSFKYASSLPPKNPKQPKQKMSLTPKKAPNCT